MPTKTSDLSNDSGYITNEALNSYATKAELPTKVSQLENDSEYITALGAPVQSVNGKTGDVVLAAVDVGALPSGTKIPNKTSDLINDSGYITESAVPTKTSELINDSGYVDITAAKNAAPVQSVNSKTGTVVIGKTDVGLGNVDNVKQYSISNPPPYPVTSVNGKTGDVTIEVGGNVDSVNGKTGAVVLSAADIGALPNTTVIPDKTSQLDNDSGFITSAPVTSVNTKIGAVTLSATDVSAIPSTLTGTAGQVLTKTADGQEWKDVDIPNALPNPNALTFTGAVTGSYDGSAPLSVEIPSGGDAGKRVRHIATVSVTAGTTSYNVTVDSNGDPLNLESVYILTSNFWGSNGSYVQVSINGKELTRAYGQSGSPQALELEKMGELQKFTNIPKPSNVGISFGNYYNGKSAVTSVGFWSPASNVDTTIEIYGVDA